MVLVYFGIFAANSGLTVVKKIIKTICGIFSTQFLIIVCKGVRKITTIVKLFIDNAV